jgi:hypothetical protein
VNPAIRIGCSGGSAQPGKETAFLVAMARPVGVAVPGHPHPVTQRGNGRARTFFCDATLRSRDLLAEKCRNASVEV